MSGYNPMICSLNVNSNKPENEIFFSKAQTVSIDDLVFADNKGLSFQEFAELLVVIEEMKISVATHDKTYNFPMQLKEVLQLFDLWKSKNRSLNIRIALAQKKQSEYSFVVSGNLNNEKIFEMREAGSTLREIAQTLKISISAVQRALSKNLTHRVINY